MSEETPKTTVTIDGVDYVFEDLTAEQQMVIRHLTDLDQKIAAAKFGIDQLQVSRDAFFAILKNSLQPAEEAAA